MKQGEFFLHPRIFFQSVELNKVPLELCAVTILLKRGDNDSGFSNQSGYSTISGSLMIRAGKLKVERLKIKP
jgi:hypothetical protein